MTPDPVVALIRDLIANLHGAPDDWASFSMVIGLSGGRLSGTHGYTYAADGAMTPTSSRPSGIRPALEAFLDDRFGPDGVLPVKMLVQYDRDTQRYEVTFEDTDASRWMVTPANVEKVPEQIRPNLA
jgi:hypothetical protein